MFSFRASLCTGGVPGMRLTALLLLISAFNLVVSMDFVFDSSEVQSHMEQSRENVERRILYEEAWRQSHERKRQLGRENRHRQNRDMTGHVHCLVHPGTPTQQQKEVLRWICSPQGGNSSCRGIRPGGHHFHPNTTMHHLEWAMSNYHEMHENDANFGYRSCWFGGVAYLQPPPRNLLFLASSNVTKEPALALSGEYAWNLGHHDNLAPGGSMEYTATAISAVCDRKVKTQFMIQVMAVSSASRIQGEVAFDFEGDGIFDRTEIYHVADLGGGDVSSYTRKSAGMEVVGAAFKDMKNGAVRMRLFNTGEDHCKIFHAIEAAPSYVTIPYFPY